MERQGGASVLTVRRRAFALPAVAPPAASASVRNRAPLARWLSLTAVILGAVILGAATHTAGVPLLPGDGDNSPSMRVTVAAMPASMPSSSGSALPGRSHTGPASLVVASPSGTPDGPEAGSAPCPCCPCCLGMLGAASPCTCTATPTSGPLMPRLTPPAHVCAATSGTAMTGCLAARGSAASSSPPSLAELSLLRI